MRMFHLAPRRDQSRRGPRQARVVYQGTVLPGISLIVRWEAVAFFLVLAAALELLIMPWALDTHPLIVVKSPHGRIHSEHVTRHAGPLVRYAGTLVIIAVTVVATLAHEVGHAMALRRAGATEITITVYGAGGACRGQARDTSPLALFWYAAAGPLVTLSLVILLVAGRMALPMPHVVHAMLWLCAAIQAGILTLNLVPILRRSDGGHMLAALATLLQADRGGRLVATLGLCSITAALLGALQGDARSALFCCALTVLLGALLARVAWAADRRSPTQAAQVRPTDLGRTISLW
ncbi:MAG: hypothetical protein ACRDGS_13055 [Chloroflexota bacterium]